LAGRVNLDVVVSRAAGIEAWHDGAEREATFSVGENVATQAVTGVVVIALIVSVPQINDGVSDRAAGACENVPRKVYGLPPDAPLSEVSALRRSRFEERSLSLG
jgi:hypothetical protein